MSSSVGLAQRIRMGRSRCCHSIRGSLLENWQRWFSHKVYVLNQRRSLHFQVIENETPHLLLDVRPEVEMELCSIPNSFNLPLARLKEGKDEDIDRLRREGQGKQIYLICR